MLEVIGEDNSVRDTVTGEDSNIKGNRRGH